MKYILTLLVLMIIIQACSTEIMVYKPGKYEFNKHMYKILLDSVIVEKVIDDRKDKDPIIGYTMNSDSVKTSSLSIDKPLTEFLKKGFNYYLSEEEDYKKYIPVTVHIKDFNTIIQEGWRGDRIFHSYSFVFDYPLPSGKTKSILISDTLALKNCYAKNSALDDLYFDALITPSFYFIHSFNHNKLDSYLPDTSKSYFDKDSFQFCSKYSIGSQFEYDGSLLFGQSIYNYSFLKISAVSESQISDLMGGISLSAEIYSIPKHSFMAFGPGLIIRYNIARGPVKLYADINSNLMFGMEDSKFKYLFMGPHFEQTIGTKIWFFSVYVGVFEQTYWGSKLLPSDFGYILSIKL